MCPNKSFFCDHVDIKNVIFRGQFHQRIGAMAQGPSAGQVLFHHMYWNCYFCTILPFDVLWHIKCAKKSLNIFLRKLQINEAAQSSTLQEFSYEFQLDPENLNTSRTFCRRVLILHEPRWVLSLFSSQALDILGSRKQVPDKQTSPVIRKVEFQLTRL